MAKGDFHAHTFNKNEIRKIVKHLPLSNLEELALLFP